MKNTTLAFVAAIAFFIANLLTLVVCFDGRHGGFNLFAYLVAQEIWPFETGEVFKISFLLLESFIVYLILDSSNKKGVIIFLIILLCFLSWPFLDFSGL